MSFSHCQELCQRENWPGQEVDTTLNMNTTHKFPPLRDDDRVNDVDDPVDGHHVLDDELDAIGVHVAVGVPTQLHQASCACVYLK